MTAQVPDFAVVDGVEYALAGIEGQGLFDPAAHGIEPRMISTGCWRGYVCWYEVAGARLVLSRLVLGPGTSVGGAPLAAGAVLLGVPVVAAADALWQGCWDVAGPAAPVAFTGRLLLGADFVATTYVHMGHAPAWKYRQVLDVTVDGGRVTGVVDRSAEMARVRDRVTGGDADDPDGPRGGEGWVERTFTLGFRRSGL